MSRHERKLFLLVENDIVGDDEWVLSVAKDLKQYAEMMEKREIGNSAENVVSFPSFNRITSVYGSFFGDHFKVVGEKGEIINREKRILYAIQYDAFMPDDLWPKGANEIKFETRVLLVMWDEISKKVVEKIVTEQEFETLDDLGKIRTYAMVERNSKVNPPEEVPIDRH